MNKVNLDEFSETGLAPFIDPFPWKGLAAWSAIASLAVWWAVKTTMQNPEVSLHFQAAIYGGAVVSLWALVEYILMYCTKKARKRSWDTNFSRFLEFLRRLAHAFLVGVLTAAATVFFLR